MRVLKQILCSTVAIPTLLSPIASADEAPPHSWESIQYQELPCPWAGGITTPSLHPSEKGLTLKLRFTRPGFGFLPAEEFVEPEPDKIVVRLHNSDGSIVEHFEPDLLGNVMLWEGGSLGRTAIFRRVFPWGDNNFDEAWVELRYPGHVFWLAVPYGFTRNPLQKLCASSTEGRPKLAPAMETLEEDAKIVRWKRVEYDLGAIQNDWRLRLFQSNPFDANCELVLYRDDSKIGKSSYLWDLHSPRTSVKVMRKSEVEIVGHAIGLRLHADGLRRSDDFEFNRNPTNRELRDWGKVVIKVEEKSYEAVLPSSLFRYCHGQATWDPRSVLR